MSLLLSLLRVQACADARGILAAAECPWKGHSLQTDLLKGIRSFCELVLIQGVSAVLGGFEMAGLWVHNHFGVVLAVETLFSRRGEGS